MSGPFRRRGPPFRRGVALAAGLGAIVLVCVLWALPWSRSEPTSPPAVSDAGASSVEEPAPRLPAPTTAERDVESLGGPDASRAAADAAAPGRDAPADAAVAPAALPPPPNLRVHVVDAAGLPVAAAVVSVGTNPPASGTADADGLAAFVVPAGEELAVCARHPDHRLAVAHVVARFVAHVATPPGPTEPTDVTLVLEPHLTACVRVESEDGAPIGGATVEFRESHDGTVPGTHVQGPAFRERAIARQHLEGRFHEARVAGRDGTCCVAGLTPGRVVVSVVADGFVRAGHVPFDVDADGGDLGVVRLQRAREVPGIVLDAEGPVPGALVESQVSAHDYVHVTTDADGRFVLRGVRPEATWLEVRAGHETRGDYYDRKEPVPSAGLTLVLSPPLRATLRLRDAATRRPVDAECAITPRMPSGSVRYLEVTGRRTVTPEDGVVVVERLHSFALGLRVEVSGYGRRDVDTQAIVDAAGAPIELLLDRHGTIAVRALDRETARPVPGAKLLVTNVRQGANGPLHSFRLVEARYDEAAGAYLVDTSVFNLLPGQDEWLMIDADGYARSAELPVIRDGVRVGGSSMEVLLERL